MTGKRNEDIFLSPDSNEDEDNSECKEAILSLGKGSANDLATRFTRANLIFKCQSLNLKFSWASTKAVLAENISNHITHMKMDHASGEKTVKQRNISQKNERDEFLKAAFSRWHWKPFSPRERMKTGSLNVEIVLRKFSPFYMQFRRSDLRETTSKDIFFLTTRGHVAHKKHHNFATSVDGVAVAGDKQGNMEVSILEVKTKHGLSLQRLKAC